MPTFEVIGGITVGDNGSGMGTNKKLNRSGDKRGMSPSSRNNLALGRKPNNRTQKDYSITRIIKEMLDLPAEERWLEAEDKDKKFTWRQAIAKRVLVEAVRGNAKVTGDLFDRLEGKITQPIGGGNSEPIILKVVYDNSHKA